MYQVDRPFRLVYLGGLYSFRNYFDGPVQVGGITGLFILGQQVDAKIGEPPRAPYIVGRCCLHGLRTHLDSPVQVGRVASALISG